MVSLALSIGLAVLARASGQNEERVSGLSCVGIGIGSVRYWADR